MRKCIKKYQYRKDNGIYYLEKDNTLYSLGLLKLSPNSILTINNDLWEVNNSYVFPSIVKYIYKTHYKLKPNTFNKLINENINLIKVLVIKGRNIDIKIECDGKKQSLENGEVVNGIHIVEANELDSFLNEYNFYDQVKEYKLSY